MDWPKHPWQRLKQRWPELAVTGTVLLGAGLAYGADAVAQSRDLAETTESVGVGLLTGGLIGIVLLIIEQRRENDRDAHDGMLATEQRRHALAVALATKDDLRGIVLAGQDLRDVVLSGRDLSDANLYGACLAGANLLGANLSGSTLKRADCAGALFRDADLTGADLGFANLTGASFFNADLSDARLYGTDMTESDLSRANLSGADLTMADMSRADLGGTSLLGASQAANLDGVKWTEHFPPRWPCDFDTPGSVVVVGPDTHPANVEVERSGDPDSDGSS